MPFKSESPWPARAAYMAATLFLLASAGTNVIYGWSKGDNLASSTVWAAVSLAVSLVFSLCFPALIQCCERQKWARAGIIAIAMALTGSYSVAAALGSAMSGRTNAATEEKTVSEVRAKAQAAYDLANADLQKLTNVRPVAELRALIDAAQRDHASLPNTRNVAQLQALVDSTRTNPQAADCAAVNGSNRVICPRLAQWKAELSRATQRHKLEQEITVLTAELARAEQRAKLKAELEAASEKWERIGAPKQANSDAVALSAYMTGLGLPVDADRLNKLLVLLAVLVVEFGGGLALSVGMGLSDPTTVIKSNAIISGTITSPMLTDVGSTAAQCDRDLPSQSRFLEMLRARGGFIRDGQRALARMLGLSKTQVNRLIADLVKARLISVSPGPKGTAIQLLDR